MTSASAPDVYDPAAARREDQTRQLALDIVERVFGGSASELMMHALAPRKTTKAEIEEMRRLLNEHERKLR